MNDLCVCKKGVGFAVVTCLTAVGLTQTAPGVGIDFPPLGGPSCADVSGLPFTDTGDTTLLDCEGNPIGDDFQEECPDTQTGGPDDVDVFYRYLANAADDAADGTPDGIVRMNIDTCGADFDTKLYVYDEAFVRVACVDDSCATSGGAGFAANINDVGLMVGTTYFIAVDSWGPSAGVLGAGAYTLNLTSAFECVIEDEQTLGNLPPCDVNESDEAPGDPSGSTPPCSTAVLDDGIPDESPATDNNTCATTTEAISCNEVFCGTSGTWSGNPDCSVGGDDDCTGDPGSCNLVNNTCIDEFFFRDFDYVPFTVPVDVDEMIFRMTAEFTLNIFLLSPTPDCDNLVQEFGFAGTGACVTTTVTATDVAAGDYYLVPTSAFNFDETSGGADCGASYLLEVECNLACPTDLDGDGSTGFTDLTTLLGSWGACPVVP